MPDQQPFQIAANVPVKKRRGKVFLKVTMLLKFEAYPNIKAGGLCLLLLTVLLTSQKLHSESLTIATGDGRPYIFAEGGTIAQQQPGFSIEIVQAAARLLNWDITFSIQPFSRQISGTRAGRYDAAMAMFPGDAPSFVFPKQAIATARNCFYKKSQSPFRYTNTTSLDMISLAVTNGYTYGGETHKALDDYIARNGLGNIITIAGQDKNVAERLIAMLKANRIDAFIEAEAVVAYHLQEKRITGIKIAGCTPTLSAFLAFSPEIKNSERRAAEFDRAVESLRSSGELKKILDRYSITDWNSPQKKSITSN